MDPDSCHIIYSRLLADTTAESSITVWGMPMWACWVLIAVMLLVSGLFSASENSYTNCNKYHFQSLANKGNRTAKIITRHVDNFDNTLVAVLVGNNIVQTLMSYLSAMLFYNICNVYGLSEGLESILSTVVMAFLVYIVSDTVPKILSKSMPNRMAIFLAYPVLITEILLFPVVLLFKGVLALAHKIFKVKDQSLLSKEELLQSVSVAVNEEEIPEDEEEEAEKLFEKDETEILDNVLAFDSLKVKDIYIPMEKVHSIDITGLTADMVNEEILSHDFSRIPVYEDSKDNIVGILVVRTYFEEYSQDKHLNIRSILESPAFIEKDLPIDDAFENLNREHVHLGIVTDAGKPIGVISMEDILEELVDDIAEDNSIKKARKAA